MMEGFNWNDLLPLLTGVAGLAMGFALPYAKNFVIKTENKIDDAVWNKLVNEFVAAGVITSEQVAALKNQSTS